MNVESGVKLGGKIVVEPVCLRQLRVGLEGEEMPTYEYGTTPERDHYAGLTRRVVHNTIDYYPFPYVWGGNFRHPVNVARTVLGRRQSPGSWRAGQPLVRGGDCSAWVQHNFGSNLGLNPYRNISCEQLVTLPRMGTVLPRGRYGEGELAEGSMPADLLFVYDTPDGPPGHVMIVVGDGWGSECAGTKDPDHANIPEKYWTMWREYANPEGHGFGEEKRGGVQFTPVAYYADRTVSLMRPRLYSFTPRISFKYLNI